MRTGSPAPGALHLADTPHDEIALDSSQPIEKQEPVEMVELVLQRAGEQVRPFDGVWGTGPIEGAHDDARGTRDGRVEAGHAEAPFFLELHPFALDEFRVDEREQLAAALAQAEIDHRDPERDAHLWGSQPNSRRRVHRLNHVVDELVQVGVERCHGGGRSLEIGRAVTHEGPKHQAGSERGASREASASWYRCQAASTSATLSLPNFSRTASASTRHTIASPTTAAAGTAQTSLRSIVAAAADMVSRSIERSGFINV